MRFNEFNYPTHQLTFTLVMGGAGSGKNYYISHNPALNQALLIDIDAFKQDMDLSTAIASIKPKLEDAFSKNIDVVHPTTGSSLIGQKNKIKLARKYDYMVNLILIDTNPKQAITQVQTRTQHGGHDVSIDRIISSNDQARENYKQLIDLVDSAIIISHK